MHKRRLLHSLLIRGAFAILVILASLTVNAYSQTKPKAALASSNVQVTHILGFEDVPRNLKGALLIQNRFLQFQSDGRASAQVNLASIEKIYLGEQDKQVGGIPMTLGKAAVPFGGGRVVSLFSHKKYDTVVLEYRDSQGGFHGAIFRLPKGQGVPLKDALIAHGAHTTPSETPTPLQSTRAESGNRATWSLQVDRIDAGATALDPCFSNAIYENLLREMDKSKLFNNVLRSGDRKANDVSGLLVLKTTVEKYSAGSETRRAVTTVSGATKLKVHIQLVTSHGDALLDRTVEGNVRFIGDNLKATNRLANNTAKLLKRSSLQSAATLPHQVDANKSASGI
jgi:hypothetical protein